MSSEGKTDESAFRMGFTVVAAKPGSVISTTASRSACGSAETGRDRKKRRSAQGTRRARESKVGKRRTSDGVV